MTLDLSFYLGGQKKKIFNIFVCSRLLRASLLSAKTFFVCRNIRELFANWKEFILVIVCDSKNNKTRTSKGRTKSAKTKWKSAKFDEWCQMFILLKPRTAARPSLECFFCLPYRCSRFVYVMMNNADFMTLFSGYADPAEKQFFQPPCLPPFSSFLLMSSTVSI